MALTHRLIVICSSIALLSGAMLIHELWQWNQTRKYNTEVEQARFADAEPYRGDYGLFAKAYAEQQRGEYQDARIIYGKLENADDKPLRLAVLFNMGNTYLQQASSIDLDADADLALPLIELAKVSYREVLNIDSQHWDAKYNLERALQLLPDSKQQRLEDLMGRRRTVHTVTTPDPEDDLP
jgi:mxaK protein